MGKFIKKEELEKTLKDIRSKNQTLVTTNGCFDVLHIGHVKYLQKSKSFGDVLMVLLNSDKSVRNIKGPTRPINNEIDRAELLCALSCVDYVILFDENSPAELLKEIKPDIHTKGQDYNIETLPEAKIIMENGGKIEFIEFVQGKSTTSILEKMNKT